MQMQNSQLCTKPVDEKISQNVMMQNSESEQSSYIFEIPVEVLGNLLDKYISHADKLQLRSVHPFFRFLFDTYIGFRVTLDNSDTVAKSAFISELAIRKVIILDWTGQKSRSLVFDKIFLSPHLIQEVVIRGDVNAKFFSDIVRSCISLKSLELCPGSCIKKSRSSVKTERHVLPEIDFGSTSPPQKYYMTRCLWVKLLLNADSLENSGDLNCEAVLALMKCIRSPFLKRAVIQGWISERFSVSRLTLTAAEFLERNPGIQSFFLGVIYDHFILDDEPFSEEDSKLQKVIVEKLKIAGDIMKVQKFGISTQSGAIALWKEFIMRQSFLVHVSFTVDLVEGALSADMFRSCRHTLSQFIFRGKFRTAFDFTWIEDCHNLKEICLHNIEHSDQTTNTDLHAINTTSVPKSLESLVLFQTVTRSDEIFDVIKKLKLKTLVLFKTGNNAGETGLNVECLKLIFRCRTLQSILLVRFVASNPIEAAELVSILQAMNDGQIHREVTLTDEVEPLLPENDEILDDEEDPPPLREAAELHEEIASSSTIEQKQLGNSDIDEATLLDKDDERTGNDACTSELRNTNAPASEPEAITSEEPPVNDPCNSIKNKSGAQSNNDDDSLITSNLNTAANMEPNLQILPDIEEKGGEIGIGESRLQQLSSVLPTSKKSSNSDPPSAQPDANDNFDDDDNQPDMIDDDPNTTDALLDPSSGQEDTDTSEDGDWEDVESDHSNVDSDDEEPIPIFDLDMNEVNIDVLEQVADAQAAAGGPGNVHLILNLQNENDLHDMLGMLEPVAANNIQFGFILDGVIDIQGVDAKRSRWMAVEDEDGHLTYTLKISID